MPEINTCETTLAERCAWLRADLAYRAPEQWPGRISWWLDDTERRFGERTAPQRDAIYVLRSLVGDMAEYLACLDRDGERNEGVADFLARLRPLVDQLDGGRP